MSKYYYLEHRKRLRSNWRANRMCAHHGMDPREVCGSQGSLCAPCSNYYCTKHRTRHHRRCPATAHYQGGHTTIPAHFQRRVREAIQVVREVQEQISGAASSSSSGSRRRT